MVDAPTFGSNPACRAPASPANGRTQHLKAGADIGDGNGLAAGIVDNAGPAKGHRATGDGIARRIAGESPAFGRHRGGDRHQGIAGAVEDGGLAGGGGGRCCCPSCCPCCSRCLWCPIRWTGPGPAAKSGPARPRWQSREEAIDEVRDCDAHDNASPRAHDARPVYSRTFE